MKRNEEEKNVSRSRRKSIDTVALSSVFHCARRQWTKTTTIEVTVIGSFVLIRGIQNVRRPFAPFHSEFYSGDFKLTMNNTVFGEFNFTTKIDSDCSAFHISLFPLDSFDSWRCRNFSRHSLNRTKTIIVVDQTQPKRFSLLWWPSAQCFLWVAKFGNRRLDVSFRLKTMRLITTAIIARNVTIWWFLSWKLSIVGFGNI